MGREEEYMREAIALSRKTLETRAGGPFGALIVRTATGEVVGRGWNRVTSTADPTAHAEIEAIRDACRHLRTFSLEGCFLYTSCEPCPMCLGALYWARLDGFRFAATREDAAAIGFDDAFIYSEMALPASQRRLPSAGLLREEGVSAMAAWRAREDRIPY